MNAAPSSNERWRLASITVRRFRGVAREQAYEFNGLSGLLHGNNGVGKSNVALALQWVLFGRFPGGVLANTAFDKFLVPVGGKGKHYSGEVVLTRSGEKAVVCRDGESGQLTVFRGEQTITGASAESALETLLGLDMDTFVRAVLLQQSRIRGLLLDDPKERNRALDRLIGMEAVEQLLELIKPKEFEKAAGDRRARAVAEEDRRTTRENLLKEQYEEAQRRARELGFLNKDLNPTGLHDRHAELGLELVAAGKRYGVEIPPLPDADTPAGAAVASRAFADGLRSIRLEADLTQRLVPVQKALANLLAFRGGWLERLADRGKVQDAITALSDTQGERAQLAGLIAELQSRIGRLREELKAADALRQLLGDTLALVGAGKPAACPVCEQALPETLDLNARLRARVASVASEEIGKLQNELEHAQAALDVATAGMQELGARINELARCQELVDRHREKVEEALGGSGIAESKVLARIDEAHAAAEAERERLDGETAAMGRELERLDLKERALREGLLPVVAKRDEIAADEKAGKEAKARHAEDEARAQKLEQVAANLDTIRKALLEAKQELASRTLLKAGPRAQELYRRLVRQPVFDTLTIQATPRANKVDYTFAVSSKGSSPTERDARLVLSDGQITATALALFFGLAETTSHSLDLLYVDDPTQNLDLPAKEAMAKAITELASRRQVIVSTQDEDFVSFLKTEGFPKLAVVHSFQSWDGNPSVRTTGPD